VHGDRLAALPGILHDEGLADVDHLFEDVEFAQAVVLLLGRQRIDQRQVLVMHVAHMWRSQMSTRPAR
jgi:hypothetical protein